MDELSSVLVSLDVGGNPTIHAIFASVEAQANSQLPEPQQISIRVDMPPVDPPANRDGEVPRTGGYIRQISVRDAIMVLTGFADLQYTVLENERQIVIKEKIH